MLLFFFIFLVVFLFNIMGTFKKQIFGNILITVDVKKEVDRF